MEFRIEPDDDGGYVWRALDELGAEIVVSRRLASRHACKRAILLFKVEASAAAVYDLTEAPRRFPAATRAPLPPSSPAPAPAPAPAQQASGARQRVRRPPLAQRRSASSRQRP